MIVPAEERLARLAAARDSAKELLGSPPARWENECEGLFKKFRLACIHLQKDREVLDQLDDKESAWRFICKLCRERPFLHDRCTEVLRILMLSDSWMRKFVEDPEVDVGDLPPSIVEEFRKRAEEVEPGQPKAREQPAAEQRPQAPRDGARGPQSQDPARPQPGVPSAQSSVPLPPLPAGVAVVVQRCSSARVLRDEVAGDWGEIGRGLVVSLSFAQKATEDCVKSAARFLLTAKLSTGEKLEPNRQPRRAAYGSDAESVLELCRRGEEQGILVMPQASLVASVGGDDLGLSYDEWSAKEAASTLYAIFIESLHMIAKDLLGLASGSTNPFAKGPRMPVIVAGPFTGRQFMDLTSSGPFMHSFNF